MRFFDRNPGLFRVVLGTIALLLLAFAGFSIYRFGTGTTDENWFKEAPSRLCFTAPIPGTSAGAKSKPDSILAGDILVSVGGKNVRFLSDLTPLLSEESTGEITLDVLRPTLNRTLSFLIRPERLDTSVVREIPPFAHVFDVTSGGASDRAGMKPGDLIVRINGLSFRTVSEADHIMSAAQAGKTIQYDVLRDNRPLTLHVTLARFGLSLSFLVMLACGFAWMGTGLYLGMRRPNIAGARLCALFFVLVGGCFTFVFVRPDVGPGFSARQFLLNVITLFAFPLFLHTLHYFPAERQDLLSRPWLRRAAYMLAAGFLLTGLFWRGAPLSIAVVILSSYFLVVIIRYRKTAPQGFREIIRPFKSAVATALVLSLLITFFAGVASPAGVWMKAGYIGLPLAAIPAVLLYIIGKHRLLDMEIRLRRTLQYGLAATAWRISTFALYVVLLLLLAGWHPAIPSLRLAGGSIELLDTPAGPEEAELARTVFVVLAAILLTLAFSRIGRKGLEVIGHRFHRAQYDYRRWGAELSEMMATTFTMADLARGIVEKLALLMQLKRVGIVFFRNEHACCCQEVQGFDGREWNAFCLREGEQIAGSLGAFSGEIRSEYLPPTLKEEFARNGFFTIIPVRSKERLIGAILLGEKESEAAFGAEDFEFLTATAHQASVAIENAFLYEELAGQERMKHELAIARRIQLDSLPQQTPSVAGLDVSGISIPALEVGGDYYDYLDGALNSLTVVVGDVSGKGTSAALYMSRLQGIFRSLHEFGLAPREMLIRTNRLLYGEMERGSFITAVSALFEPSAQKIVLARAGHPPLLHLDAGARTVERLLPRGLGLGMRAGGVFDAELEERVVPYGTGDLFLFVTDGITEARSANGELFGEKPLEGILLEADGCSADEVRNRVIAAVNAFTAGAGQADDQTVVVVRALPLDPSSPA